MFALGNSLFVCRRSQCSRGGSGWDGCRRRRLPPPLAPEPRPLTPLALAPRTRPAESPTWSSDVRGRYFAWNWTIPVVMLATVNCGNNCNVVAKLVQEYHMFLTHFTSVLRKQFAVNDTFLREANIYKRALALRNSRLVRPVVHTSSK